MTAEKNLWATYIHDRRPPFKTHGSRQAAENAVNLTDNWGGEMEPVKRGGSIFMLKKGAWQPFKNVKRA
jgi:hypothetical protein